MSTVGPTLAQSNVATAQALGTGPHHSRRGKFINRGKLLTVLYLMMLPTILGMATFIFYPQVSAIKFSLYDWDGDQVQEYRGLKNFIEAFTQDPKFWACFQLTGILLAANLVKMWPSIFTAVALHRIKSEKAQYLYRVFFVIPMIIPGLVMLLMWKSFYDPTIGILNIVLNKTGLMSVLNWLDQVMPPLSNAPSVVFWRDTVIANLFGGVWGMVIFATFLFSVRAGFKGIRKSTFWWTMIMCIGAIYWYGAALEPERMVGDTFKFDPTAIGIAIVRLAIATGVAWGVSILAARSSADSLLYAARWVGTVLLAIAVIFIFGTMVWTEEIRGFAPPAEGVPAAPSWLGNSNLIIPSIIFWGFPWIGTVGVLIYLAGLQSISQDVYEAAQLDGVSSLGKFFSIELPLIMTQVRINLIFMTISTLSDYALLLLLLGAGGGPGGKGMVPGLYAYSAAFSDQRFGYACALGMVMFFIILFITVIYQKYVKVDK